MIATTLSVLDIEGLIIKNHGGADKVLAIPNVKYGFGLSYEADLLVVSQKGYVTEYEIKRSWEDFKKDTKKKHNAHLNQKIYNFAYVVPKSILNKVRELLESNYKSQNLPCVYSYEDNGAFKKEFGKLHTPQRRDFGCRQITLEERYQLARLGTLRYWQAVGVLKPIVNSSYQEREKYLKLRSEAKPNTNE